MASDEREGSARLLLADDSKLMRVSAEKVLSGEFDVVFAADGEQAWEHVTTDDAIQAVFTDLSMPNLDGFGLLERIRTAEEERINSLPVVIITAGEDESIREQAYQGGATDFVGKPFDSVDLRARARSHVSARVQTSRLAETSMIDPQTGLYNRRYFLERLSKDRSAAARHDLDLTLLYLQFEDFRTLFLKNGKDVANEILRRVSEIIRHEIRSEDTAAHTGLAQFALSLPLTDSDGAHRLRDRLQARIGETQFSLRTDAIPVTATTGLLQVSPDRDTTPEQLLAEVAAAAG